MTLLQDWNVHCVSAFHTKHLVPEPLYFLRVKHVLCNPQGRILFTEQIVTAGTKWGHVHGSAPGAGGRGAVAWVAAACAAASLGFVLVAGDGEPLGQQLSNYFYR